MSYDNESRARAQARARLEGALSARSRRRRMNDIGKVVAGGVIAIIAAIVIIFAISQHNDWKASCEKRGGHVSSHTNWNGDSDTTYYCLNDNGGIIDIR